MNNLRLKNAQVELTISRMTASCLASVLVRETLNLRLGCVPLTFFSSRPVTALLAEAERLGQERVDVQRQAEKDRVGLAGRLRVLEVALEEHESRAQQQEEQHRAQTEDLQQHINALEKQLKHHRQFIDVSVGNENGFVVEIPTVSMITQIAFCGASTI